MKEELRVIISGGGTGGHIFPAISIANAIKAQHPDAQILFVGAEGRMEMKRVPAAGYDIKALPICGFDRKNLLKNISVLFKIFKSQKMAKKIIKDFRPMVAVGVGGYASGPTLNVAESLGIPTLLQEQNSYAGVTNKLLARKASKICVAYENMDRFFPKEKIILTGNPIRQDLTDNDLTKEQVCERFKMQPDKPTILIIGGSLGAQTLNRSVMTKLNKIAKSDIQIIWQCGGYYFNQILEELTQKGQPNNLFVTDFISNMKEAYAAADLVVSRAGAGSISELCCLGKPVILVPSPNVAEDHQTKNALALVDKEAALYIKDSDAERRLIPLAIETVQNKEKLKNLSKNIKTMAYPDAAKTIAEEVYKLAVAYNNKD